MTRRDKVLAALIELTKQSRADHDKDSSNRGRSFFEMSVRDGFTTEMLAQRAGILRSNCSTELNALVRDGVIEKTLGRPALYRLSSGKRGFFLPEERALSPADTRKSSTPSLTRMAEGKQTVVSARIPTKRPPGASPLERLRGDEFDWGVATERSLRDAVQQAKMALTYPPHGMHILLLGETGVGKSTFSRRMHNYACLHGVLDKKASFVSFNCAEYANNQEILLDQLFGHIRGAYTGAHGDKAGLVEQANGGMLFLDEVHRLPPQGQEMLFHLLDYGTFRRLGETQIERRARVLIVAATTESPESTLLSTFRRRIPVVIRLPALREWTLYDRYELVYSLCREEAEILGMPVRISAPALDTLLFSRFSANIGDLKNAIKLACARAFNDELHRQPGTSDEVEVFEVLPEHVVIPQIDSPTGALLRNLEQSIDLVVTPDGQGPPPLPILEEGSRYAKLDKLSQSLYELGFDTEDIIESLERELNKQDQAATAAGPSSLTDLQQFIGEPLFSELLGAWQEMGPGLPNPHEDTAFLRIVIHLYGVIRSSRPYLEIGEGGLGEVVNRVRTDVPELYHLAASFLYRVTKITGVPLPDYETAIVAMMLRPVEGEQLKHIGVVVALFGDTIARNMVDTATRLTDGHRAVAADISFQLPPYAMDSRLTDAVMRADEGKGVLLLTDVPRFAEAGGWNPPAAISVSRVLRPDLRTIVMALQGSKSDRLALRPFAEWLNKRNQGLEMLVPSHKRIVWGCCLTGKGTARAVQRLIDDALPEDLRDRVEVIPKELGHSDIPLVPDEGLVATVGSVNPGVFGVPFFSVETLLTKEGIDQLLNVLYLGDGVAPEGVREPSESAAASSSGEGQDGPVQAQRTASTDAVVESSVTVGQMEQYVARLLQRDLVFVNPDVALRVSKKVWRQMLDGLANVGTKVLVSDETFVRFSLHTAYVIERLIKQEALVHPYMKQIKERYPEEWAVMTAAWHPISDAFRIAVNEQELAYLFEIVFANRGLEVFDR